MLYGSLLKTKPKKVRTTSMFEEEEIENSSYIRPMGIKKEIYKRKMKQDKIIRYSQRTKPLVKKSTELSEEL